MRLLAALLMAVWGCTAYASNCASRDHVIGQLKNNYTEQLSGAGINRTDKIFEVWWSPEKRTWTILMTTVDGRSCIMASGTDWMVVKEVVGEKS